ncbi:MAG: T9SS type A sorting domain-containing protein, partial [Ignavibacteriaceae bacterium]
ISVNTLANGLNGSWITTDWPGWGGNQGFYLEIVADNYLNSATFPDALNIQSPFIISENVLEINYPSNSPIRLIDTQGNITGYSNNLVFNEIPGSLPRMIKNGSETPPYGYTLVTDDYSIVLNEFENDTVDVFFFTGNKSFSYERYGATTSQTDRLFFDGGISAVNPDVGTKTINLLNIINETSQEKLTVVRSLELVQNDSVKIENPDSNKVKLISYGTAKSYDVEINYVTENGIGRFGDFNIPLTANTSHTFVPDWTNLTNSQLVVLVDIGNNGTIDDTLYISNTVDVEDHGSLLTPDSYNLAQNYPNPFNPSTSIQYAISSRQFVSLKVYDVLGNEIATLVNEEKDRGVYTVNFDATSLASGIYLYRIQAGSFTETKKMILMK